jgi:deoxyribodipyrimidine photo-lyase
LPAREAGATEVHHTYDVTPFDRARSRRLDRALQTRGLGVVVHPGPSVADEVRAIRTAAGGPYTAFSPFFRAWQAAPRRDVLPAPRAVPVPSKLRPRLPSLAALGLRQEVAEPLRGGEGEARRRLARFVRRDVHDYETNRDALGADGTSRLSAYLRFGCISACEAEARLPAGRAPAAFRRQLCWRDFYLHVLEAFPGNATSEFQERYRATIRWSRAKARFAAWADGRTGYPLVDAGMRQLRHEGFMHNRARLVAGSFLTKHLGIDWRLGERWFMRLLLDGDPASNNGNWQWIASVGVDPQPAFRRIYNPARHAERFDPGGDFMRRWVPALRPVPGWYLREPWRMPPELQGEVGCVIGRDYPAPIVDHVEARRLALARYRRPRATARG